MTGAAQGIGRGIVDHFLAEGATVLASDLRFVDDQTERRLTRLVLDAIDESAVAAAAAG